MLNKELIEYAETHSTPEPHLLATLNRETHLTQVSPQMLSGHLQGTLLRMISHMIRPNRVLEIGTFTGYSAINLALGLNKTVEQSSGSQGLSGAREGKSVLHTIELNPELEDGIRRFIREAGLEEQIILHIGNALEIIPRLDETWDLVFIDADKSNYLNYYHMVFPKVSTGGFIVADNCLWDGKVLENPEQMDQDTRGIVEFNEFVHCDKRVENILLPFRDGLMVMLKL